MIESINIENFKCFERSAFRGFSQINLISGKNNVGKTCLLEAFYLYALTGKQNHITNESGSAITYTYTLDAANGYNDFTRNSDGSLFSRTRVKWKYNATWTPD